VAHKKNENQPGQEPGRVPDGTVRSSEFDDAVTTEITDVLARALDGDQTIDPADIRVTDMQLIARVDPEVDDALAPGFLLNDRFEIVELVHSGGMGHVYKAIDHRRHPDGSGEIHVAIKMMRPSVASDEKARLTLEREASKAQTLSHPNIINIFDFDNHEGQFFLVMEWLEGESVNALLRRTSGQRLASSFTWPVIEGAAAGVQYAHQKNVVHADINPSNIFITDTQDIKLLDFGVARYTHNPDHPDDDRFAWVTQTYASPEVLSGLTPVFEDDVFSLACVAYRLLSGEHPFGGVPSIVAKHKGISAEPVPGLPDHEWQILRRALSYERSERMPSVSEFVTRGATAATAGKSVGRVTKRVTSLLRSLLAAVAAVVVLAGGLWLLLRGGAGEIVPSIEPVVPDQPVAANAVDATVPSPAELLLAAAAQALGNGHLVAPDENNARVLFREALVHEPENTEALRGLRAISNDFLREAQEALQSDEPLAAYAALAVAAETDPANPAIDIVNQLLAAKGSSELADARLAAATGNFNLAALRLSRAEQYSNVDPASIESLRRQIAQSSQDDQLLASLATADAHISAGRLLPPEAENAHVLLLDLQRQHGDDERLLAAMERLGERLLTRAAFAAAATRVSEATELLDAVDALGVLAPEVEAARTTLATANDAASAEVAPGLQVAEQLGGDPQPTASDIETAAGERTDTTRDDTPRLAVAAAVPEVVGEAVYPEEPLPKATPVDAKPVVRRKTVQEFGIEKYVAPEFPRNARRRGVTGIVEVGFVINPDGSTDSIRILSSEPGDVFSKSAVNAVRQWRFAPREEEIPARITLRFDLAP
jgi:TonB family protein